MSDAAAGAGGGKSIRVARVIHATADVLFQAWIDPNSAKQWWGTTEKSKLIACEIDARGGGTYFYAMQKTGESGQEVATGTFREVFPPRQLVFSWNCERSQVRDSTVTVEFSDLRDGGCRVTVVHQGLPPGRLAIVHQSGWADTLQDLAMFVSEKAAA